MALPPKCVYDDDWDDDEVFQKLSVDSESFIAPGKHTVVEPMPTLNPGCTDLVVYDPLSVKTEESSVPQTSEEDVKM
uniref:Uncharacterized protein n=1 Tax=Panagrolaimus superbus TaxID=310955 RepID=A0A914YSI0_9BILA